MYGLPDSRKPGVRYVVYVMLVLITLLCVLTWGVVSYHWIFQNSYTFPATSPNGLTTGREGPIYWVLLPITVIRLLLLTACVARSANSYNRWFKHILSLLAFVLILSEIAGLVIFVIERNACNNPPTGDPSGRNNMCNDYRWCCVYGTYNITNFLPDTQIEPSCPVVLQPCVPPVLVSDLSANWVFDVTLASTVIFMALGVLHIIISGWMKDGSEASTYIITGENEDRYFGEGDYAMESRIGLNYENEDIAEGKFTNVPLEKQTEAKGKKVVKKIM